MLLWIGIIGGIVFIAWWSVAMLIDAIRQMRSDDYWVRYYKYHNKE